MGVPFDVVTLSCGTASAGMHYYLGICCAKAYFCRRMPRAIRGSAFLLGFSFLKRAPNFASKCPYWTVARASLSRLRSFKEMPKIKKEADFSASFWRVYLIE